MSHDQIRCCANEADGDIIIQAAETRRNEKMQCGKNLVE
jgi:hypothetical protein